MKHPITLNIHDQGTEYDLMCLYVFGAMGILGHWILGAILAFMVWIVSVDVFGSEEKF